MIDVRRLEILRELDRCGTIAATAEAVHLTPSAVSQQLAALSREAGTPILEPDGRRVRLTAAAELLLTHAHQVFTHLEHAESDLAAFRRGDAGTLRLGVFPSAVRGLGVPVLSAISGSSRLRVEIREVQPEHALDALLSRRVDVALNLTPGERFTGEHDPRIESEDLFADVLDVALPADHPLAAGERVDLADLADADWILNVPGSSCWQVVTTACERRGFTPQARHYADEFTGVVSLIAAGTGVSLLPRLAQEQFAGEAIALRAVTGLPPVRRIGVQIRAGTSAQPHIQPVLRALRDAASDVASGPIECGPARSVRTPRPAEPVRPAEPLRVAGARG